uniref:SFRICE_014471 n=1 Tax=Spodoptera frugiperda TaxID=7108 RepID=A0A2H1W806_SPOFR
MEYYAKILIH